MVTRSLVPTLAWRRLERLINSKQLTKKVQIYIPKTAEAPRMRRGREYVAADVLAAWPLGQETIVLEPEAEADTAEA